MRLEGWPRARQVPAACSECEFLLMISRGLLWYRSRADGVGAGWLCAFVRRRFAGKRREWAKATQNKKRLTTSPRPGQEETLALHRAGTRDVLFAHVVHFRRDFCAGGLMILFGLVAAVNGPNYHVGTLMHMGPGFMPTALGVILILLGVADRRHRVGRLRRRRGRTAASSAGTSAMVRLALHPGRAGCCSSSSAASAAWRPPPSPACSSRRSATGPRPGKARSSWRSAITVFGVLLFHYVLQSPDARPGVEAVVMESSPRRSLVRLRRRARAAQPDVLLPRRADRQHGRRAARHGSARDHLDPAAADLRHEAGRRDPDAGGHLLRRAVWRRDLLDPAQSAVPSAARGDLPRRLPDDQAGQGRRRARHHGDRLVHRRLVGHHRDDVPGAAAGERSR